MTKSSLKSTQVKHKSMNSDDYYEMGIKYYKNGNYNEAIENFKKANEPDIEYENVDIYIGLGYSKLGQYQKAINYYDKALEINPSSKISYLNKGAAFFRMDKYQEAVECYDKALKIDPRYEKAQRFKSKTLNKLKTIQNDDNSINFLTNKFANSSLNESSSEIDYDGDQEEDHNNKNPKNKKYKKRLIIGEGNFSYVKALIIKHKDNHPSLAKSLIVTEFQSKESLKESYQDFSDNYKYVKKQGSTVEFNVDATNIKESFPNEKFSRIHFNCPYASNTKTTRLLVKGFFKSAAEVQNTGGRIHISLVDKKDFTGEERGRYWWHGVTYDIYNASTQAGYILKTKREFGSKRYPGYVHRETIGGQRGDESSKNAKFAKEFIFEKTNLTDDNILEYYEKESTAYSKNEPSYGEQCVFIASTDSESSSYIDSEADSNKTTKKIK